MNHVREREVVAQQRVSSGQSLTSPWSAENLGGLMLRSARRHGDRTALWVDGCAVSYRELLAMAAPIADALTDAKLDHGAARCAVLGSRGLTAFTGIIGALLARCTYVPLNPAHPDQRIAQMVRESHVDALVVDQDCVERARFLLEDAVSTTLVLLPNSDEVPAWATQHTRHRFLCRRDLPPADPVMIENGNQHDGAYLLYTSGSTGAPKGIQVRNRNVMSYLRSVAERYAPSPEDRFSQLFDLTFDLSVHDMFLCWGAGATLYCPPARAKFAPRDFVRRHELTMWFSVPSTAAMMMGLRMLRPGDFPTLRLSLFCGEALPRQLAAAWAAAAPNSVIENLYGPTEATIAITAYRLPTEPDALDRLPALAPIGMALPGQHAMLVDLDGQPTSGDGDGELCLAGSQVTDGYWRRPDLTAQRFVRYPWDDAERIWYRTGDRARWTADHGLVFLGRLDRQVKIAGYRIELDEIEAILQRVAGTNGAAIAWPISPDGLARGIIGFVGETDVSDATILEHCRRVLPSYAVPAAIHRVEAWPVNSNGKTDHAQLRRILER
jgi:D-alanine--poly(phosphoribitol) ligase subunit 1